MNLKFKCNGGGASMSNLVNEKNVEGFEKTYRRGQNHLYPNENIVRLEKWFFEKEGRVLDYGFGPGENLIHLLRSGYSCSGIDIVSTAKDIVIRKMEKYPQYKDKYDLHILKDDDKQLMFEDNCFDYIVSNQVVYFLADEEKIIMLLNEFKRILKPNGRLIITTMSRLNSYCIKGIEVEPNIFKCEDKINEVSKYFYIIQDQGHARDLFSMFNIQEIGWFDNYYCGHSGHHYVLLLSNMK